MDFHINIIQNNFQNVHEITATLMCVHTCTMSTNLKYNVKRNSRERKRVQQINAIIRELKNKLPVEWTSKKMGKLEIIQKSTLYIRHLIDLSNDCQETGPVYTERSPSNLRFEQVSSIRLQSPVAFEELVRCERTTTSGCPESIRPSAQSEWNTGIN